MWTCAPPRTAILGIPARARWSGRLYGLLTNASSRAPLLACGPGRCVQAVDAVRHLHSGASVGKVVLQVGARRCACARVRVCVGEGERGAFVRTGTMYRPTGLSA